MNQGVAMTMPIQFDTAQYIKRLVEAGIPRAHAEALADGLQFALSQPVATDADLVIARAEVQAMFSRHEAEMKEWVLAQFARHEAEMKEWVMAQLSAQFARHETGMKEWVMARLRPIYWLLAAIVVQQTIIMTKLFL
jgi:hypothetical protein